MSILPVAQSPTQSHNPVPRPRKKSKKNYAQIHSKPLPLNTYPLPNFNPSNPVSLVYIAYVYLSHLLTRPSSHPKEKYVGYFSPSTRSVHVTNPDHARALWESGFFGKGSLSRSEATWLEREKVRLAGGMKGGAAEDATRRRREERRLWKLERARAEREKVERQREMERSGDVAGNEATIADATESTAPLIEPNEVDEEDRNGQLRRENGTTDGLLPNGQLKNSKTPNTQPSTTDGTSIRTDKTTTDSPLKDQEHLHLTLEEAFFLSFSLGILEIYPAPASSSGSSTPYRLTRTVSITPYHPTTVVTPTPYHPSTMIPLFSAHSYFPAPRPPYYLTPDDPFLLTYATYHHFRSLGWVVRPGTKFGADFLLYNRGPVFSHAEFAVIIIPAYTHKYWNKGAGRWQRRVAPPPPGDDEDSDEESSDVLQTWVPGGKDWWSLHGVNRVQSAVKKTLVLAYVDVPSPFEVNLPAFDEVEEGERGDVKGLLESYKIREVVVRRWLVNRSRD